MQEEVSLETLITEGQPLLLWAMEEKLSEEDVLKWTAAAMASGGVAQLRPLGTLSM